MKAPYIGTAGWNVPGIHARHFDSEGTHLVRYGRKLNSAEINSSFYREHKPETYRKWADSVPEHFRFAVKVPRTITHEGELQARNQDAHAAYLRRSRNIFACGRSGRAGGYTSIRDASREREVKL